MGVDVFIVHAAPDKDTALRLRDALANAGVRAFVDRPDTPSGAPWDESIDRELRESLLQVVLLGEHTRWYQHEEIDIAIREMRAHGAHDRIVPVLLTPRSSLPYGLNRLQASLWDGPFNVAARLAEKVGTLRGSHASAGVHGSQPRAGTGVHAPPQPRVRVAVLGLRDELADALDALRRRIGQRTAILDGDVHLVDLARDTMPDVDLRVVLLRRRHGGKLALIRELVSAAVSASSRPEMMESQTIVGAIDVTLRQVPASFRSEAQEMEQLLLDVALTASTDQAVIDQLDEQVASWYTTRFPSRPGMSITRERWEERYLEDKAPLWRKGDPSALRSLGGARADRVRWYVHLKAQQPWVEVAGQLRFEVPAILHHLASDGTALRDDERALRLDLRDPPRSPRQFWWANLRLSHDSRDHRPHVLGSEVKSVSLARLKLQIQDDEVHAFQNWDATPASPWLDLVLSQASLPRCVVVGPAGTGKTVLLQHLAWVLATGEGPGTESEPVHRVDGASVRSTSPVFPVPVLHTASTLVAHLRGDRPIREALVALLRSSETFGDTADAATVRAGIDTGRYVFLIDSLDEVPRRQDRESLVAALGTLSGPTPRVILTTRPSAHTAVELPDGFVRVDIAPLDQETATRLSRAWIECWAPNEDIAQVLQAIDHVRHTFPALTDERSPVENPLLLSCLLYVYALYRRLPDDTAKLYHDMVRVLCEAKIRAVDDHERDSLVERYREALRELFLASQEFGSTRLGVPLACTLLVARGLAARGTVEGWLQALANHTGLVRFDGASERAVIRPWHRSFQEYLAAEKIALDYANRASECIAWLRTPRGLHGPRLMDPVWRGTLRFLVGAAAHQNRAWAVNLIDAMAAAAATREHDQSRLYSLAIEAVAEYANSLFQNETLRHSLPQVVIAALAIDGMTWPIADRLATLNALGRLGDPRLPDPRSRSGGASDPGWVGVPEGSYRIGAEPAVTTAGRSARKRDRSRKPASVAKSGWMANRVLPLTTCASQGFWIRRWPVTVAEFLPFIDSGRDMALPLEEIDWAYLVPKWRAQARYPTRPIVDVSWYVARAFCRWAQDEWHLPCDGVIDLPTSAEWEIAARRDTDRVYPWGNEPPLAGDSAAAAYASTIAEREYGPTPVGAFPRGHTPEGIWDMGGNVFEWCASLHDGTTDHDVPIDRIDSVPRGGQMVYRGGAWRRGPEALTVVYRGDNPPSMIGDYIGFRVVCRPASPDDTD